jgi:glutaredoxin
VPEPIQLTMVVRQGCHLCEVAENDLARVLGRFSAEYPESGFEVELVEIDARPDLEKYTDDIPVLLINGKQVAFWRIDEDRVFEQLRKLV